MKKIGIFHFSPLELYPPVMNMIRYLDRELPADYSIRVFSSRLPDVPVFTTTGKRVKIFRYGKYQVKQSTQARYQLYLQFNAGSFLNALFWRPDFLFYYESFSAMPPILLKMLRRNIPLFIHYHEYVTPTEYDNISLLSKIHRLEKKIYGKAAWISHTNQKRVELFARDAGLTNFKQFHIMPNYPPKSWAAGEKKNSIHKEVKVVYVGALGLESLYIREFARWVEKQQGRVTWDIYSQHDTSALNDFLNSIGSRHIQVKGFVSYEALPEVLRNYDVGVILYKGEMLNTIYSASNKLFEYLACGLDVWFPDEIKGSHEFIKKESFPKVLNLTFDKMDELILDELIGRINLPYVPTTYYLEDQYYILKKALIQKQEPI